METVINMLVNGKIINSTAPGPCHMGTAIFTLVNGKIIKSMVPTAKSLNSTNVISGKIKID